MRWLLIPCLAAVLVGCTPEKKPAPPATTRAQVAVCHAPTEDSRPTDCDYRDGAWRPKASPTSTLVCHAKTEDSEITDCDYRRGAWWTK